MLVWWAKRRFLPSNWRPKGNHFKRQSLQRYIIVWGYSKLCSDSCGMTTYFMEIWRYIHVSFLLSDQLNRFSRTNIQREKATELWENDIDYDGWIALSIQKMSYINPKKLIIVSYSPNRLRVFYILSYFNSLCSQSTQSMLVIFCSTLFSLSLPFI